MATILGPSGVVVRIIACCAWVLSSAVVSAATVEITRLDGAGVTGVYAGVSPTAISLQVDGHPADVRLDDIRELSLAADVARASVSAGTTVFHLAAGGMLRGAITGQGDEAVTANTVLGPETKLPLKALAGVWFDRPDADAKAKALFDDAMANRMTGKDVLVTLSDGQLNTVRGSVVALGPQGGRIALGRDERAFTLDRVLGIALATGLSGDERWPVIVRLNDGSEVSARLTDGDASSIRLRTSFGSDATLDIKNIVSMRFASDRLVYLSDMTLVRNETTGVLIEPMPASFDRNVAGGPLAIGGQRFDKGVGVHADSTLEYELGGAYGVFCATVGIDDGVRPRGAVIFSVMGDGKTLFDGGPMTGRAAAKDIRIDVTGVRRLTLTVAHGDDLDLSDRADWADARLIKPATN